MHPLVTRRIFNRAYRAGKNENFPKFFIFEVGENLVSVNYFFSRFFNLVDADQS